MIDAQQLYPRLLMV